MKRKYGLRSITLFLSMCLSVFCASFSVLLLAGEYYSARHKFDIYDKEFEGWEACRQTEPNYFEANSEAVKTCIESREKAKGNFWVTVPKSKLIGLFVLAALGSAVGGYLAVWLVWYGVVGTHRFIRWVKSCLVGDISLHISRRVEEKYAIKEIREPQEYELDDDEVTERRSEHQFDLLRDEVFSSGSDRDKTS